MKMTSSRNTASPFYGHFLGKVGGFGWGLGFHESEMVNKRIMMYSA